MKRKYATIALMLACMFLLSGCFEFLIKREIVTIVISPDDALLTDVKSETPPVMEEYSGLRYLDKEEILIDKFRTQTQNVETANSQFKSIREWKAKTLKLHEKKE